MEGNDEKPELGGQDEEPELRGQDEQLELGGQDEGVKVENILVKKDNEVEEECATKTTSSV